MSNNVERSFIVHSFSDQNEPFIDEYCWDIPQSMFMDDSSTCIYKLSKTDEDNNPEDIIDQTCAVECDVLDASTPLVHSMEKLVEFNDVYKKNHSSSTSLHKEGVLLSCNSLESKTCNSDTILCEISDNDKYVVKSVHTYDEKRHSEQNDVEAIQLQSTHNGNLFEDPIKEKETYDYDCIDEPIWDIDYSELHPTQNVTYTMIANNNHNTNYYESDEELSDIEGLYTLDKIMQSSELSYMEDYFKNLFKTNKCIKQLQTTIKGKGYTRSRTHVRESLNTTFF